METTSNEHKIDLTPKVEPTMTLIPRVHFKEKPLDIRKKKFEALMSKTENKERIPIICELHSSSRLSLKNDLKFLTNQKMSLKNFQSSIRRKMNYSEDTIFFFYQNKKILQNNTTMGTLYENNTSEDGFLYLQFSEINALG